jgi:hypothetical protein
MGGGEGVAGEAFEVGITERRRQGKSAGVARRDTSVEEQRAASRAQAQRSGQTGQPRIPGMPLPGMTGQGQNRTRQAGQGQGARQPGQFNPFKQGRTAEALTAYMKVLQKK